MYHHRILERTRKVFGILATFFIISLPAFAGLDNVAYPVSDLGNCISKQDCKEFCDLVENMTACTLFAERHHIVSPEKALRSKRYAIHISLGTTPGGCDTQQTCYDYCADPAHHGACFDFIQLLDRPTEDSTHDLVLLQVSQSESPSDSELDDDIENPLHGDTLGPATDALLSNDDTMHSSSPSYYYEEFSYPEGLDTKNLTPEEFLKYAPVGFPVDAIPPEAYNITPEDASHPEPQSRYREKSPQIDRLITSKSLLANTVYTIFHLFGK